MTASIAFSWSGVSRYGNDASSCCSHSLLEVVRDALARLPLRVERDQLGRELLHRLAGARLEQLPRLAAELRERGRGRVGADVARDLAELLVRDVEAVVAAEREQQVVARDAGDLLRLEAEQLADAVVLVHDVVAGAQVGERLQRATAEARARRGTRRRKTWWSGRSTRPSSRQTKPRRAGATAKKSPASLGSVSPGSSSCASTRRSMFCVRSASPRCGNATTTRWPARTNAASSFSASASPRAAIAGRCASNANGWPCGNGSSSVAPSSEIGVEAVLLPDAAHVVRLEDEVGRAVERRHEIVRHGPELALVAVPLLDEVEPALGGGIDRARRRPDAARAA